MIWQDLKIGIKLAIGFGCMLLLVSLAGIVGYSGIRTVGHSLTVVGDEEAPVVDAAMEMNASMKDAMTAMDEYLAATTVIATSDAGKLESIEKNFQQALTNFDLYAEAILHGATLVNGSKIIQTDNQELAALVRKANETHDSKFQTAAKAMIDDGRIMLTRKSEADSAMVAMESVFDKAAQKVNSLETLIKKEITHRAVSAHIGAEAQAILKEEIPLSDMANEVKYALAVTRISLEEFVQGSDPDVLNEIEREYRQGVVDFDQIVSATLKGGTVDGVTVIATDNAEIRKVIEELDQNHEAFQQGAEAMMTAHRAIIEQSVKVEKAMQRLDAAGEEAQGQLTEVEKLTGVEMTVAMEAGRTASKRAVFWLIGVVAGSLLLGTFLGVIITRGITGPINKGVGLATEIAKGDFSERLNLQRRDEIGQLAAALDNMANNLKQNADIAEQIAAGNLNVEVKLASEKDQLGSALQNMTNNLNDIMGQIQVAGDQIASGSYQVSDSAQSLSQGATESASSLEEISASMNEMSSQTKLNAENASIANNLSGEAKTAAEIGNRQMQEMVTAMAEINASGQSISKIIKVIDEIAFQTNLLALNAAVEAARAGQHGKGFAVVAEEVRNLAARSAKAAKETAELIESSVEKTGRGTQIADQTAKALGEIVTGVTKVTDLVEEIAAASNEQAQGIAQVNLGLTQIDQVTQTNTASAEESAAASEELSGQAAKLSEMLQRFKLKTVQVQQQKFVAPQPVLKQAVGHGWGSIASRSEVMIALDDAELVQY